MESTLVDLFPSIRVVRLGQTPLELLTNVPQLAADRSPLEVGGLHGGRLQAPMMATA